MTIIVPEWAFWTLFGLMVVNLVLSGGELFYARKLRKHYQAIKDWKLG